MPDYHRDEESGAEKPCEIISSDEGTAYCAECERQARAAAEHAQERPYGFDFHDVIISAARYYMGRMTIQTCAFARQLAEVWPELPEGTRGVIRMDLEREFERDDRMREMVEAGDAEMPTLGNFGLGQDMDRAAWEQVRAAYAAEALASEAFASDGDAWDLLSVGLLLHADAEQLAEEKLLVAEAMMRRGGSFVRHLGESLVHADPANTRKIRQTWPAYWQKYLEMAMENTRK